MLEEARKKLPEVPFEARVVPWKQTAMMAANSGESEKRRKIFVMENGEVFFKRQEW